MKKILSIVITLAFVLISCQNGDKDTRGIPEIKSFRVLAGDGEGGYVEKDIFSIEDDVFLEFTVYDDDLDITSVSIELYFSIAGRVIPPIIIDLPEQRTNPQIYYIPLDTFMTDTWSIYFFVIDKNGKKSITSTSNFVVEPWRPSN